MIDIGSLVRRCREVVGLSQKDVEKASGGRISQQEISLIERGKRPNVSFAKMNALMEAMGLTISIHEGIELTTTDELVEMRLELGITTKEMAQKVNKSYYSVLRQEKTEMEMGTLVPYLGCLGLVPVLLTKELDINEFRDDILG